MPPCDDHSLSCRATDRTEYRERRARGDPARARDDDDGDGRARVTCDRVRDGRSSQREVDQISGQAVRGFLNRSSRRLRMLDGFDDLRERRVAPDAARPHFERPRLIDASSEHVRARDLLDWEGLAGDRCLIDERVTALHDAVDWHARPRLDDDEIADGERARRNARDTARMPDEHVVREQIDDVPDRATAAIDGEMLEHLGDQDEEDDDDGGQGFANGERRDERDRHRQLHRHDAYVTGTIGMASIGAARVRAGGGVMTVVYGNTDQVPRCPNAGTTSEGVAAVSSFDWGATWTAPNAIYANRRWRSDDELADTKQRELVCDAILHAGPGLGGCRRRQFTRARARR